MNNFEISQRLNRLEQLVDGLYRHLDIPLPMQEAPNRLEPVAQLAAIGKKIQAIKLYREITGVGLKEAKNAVEAMVPKR